MDDRPLDEVDGSPVDRATLAAQAAEGDQLAQWALGTAMAMDASPEEKSAGKS